MQFYSKQTVGNQNIISINSERLFAVLSFERVMSSALNKRRMKIQIIKLRNFYPHTVLFNKILVKIVQVRWVRLEIQSVQLEKSFKK